MLGVAFFYGASACWDLYNTNTIPVVFAKKQQVNQNSFLAAEPKWNVELFHSLP